MRRTFAEISGTAIAHNREVIRSLTAPGVKLCAVIKADAYGHGATHVAEFLRDADLFGVATPGEALELRRAGVLTPILVMGLCPPEAVGELVGQNIALAVYGLPQAQAISAALAGDTLDVHMKIDTGMSRLGFADTDEGLSQLRESSLLPGLRPVAAFTHFATDDDFLLAQHRRFLSAIENLQADSLEFSVLHCANSGAVVKYPESHMDMVRPGLLLYGYCPDPDTHAGLKPAMRFCSTIVQVKTLRKGDTVSYDRTFTARESMRIAVVAAGYADGVPRALSNIGTALVRGAEVPIVGRVCMDMLMLDVSHVPQASAGDTVTLFGVDETGRELSAWTQAKRMDTIPYELICGLTRRVERFYIDEPV